MTRKPPWRKTPKFGVVPWGRQEVPWHCDNHPGVRARFWRGDTSFDGLCLKCARKRGLKIAKGKP